MNGSFFRNKGSHTFEGTYSREYFLAYFFNVFAPSRWSIYGNAQGIGMFMHDDSIVNSYFMSSVLATFKLSLLAFSQQLRLLSSGNKACLSSVNVLADSCHFTQDDLVINGVECLCKVNENDAI